MTTHRDPPTHRHEDPEDRKARIAAAWAELVAAARTEPKALAFLTAFGPAAPAPDGTEAGSGNADAGVGGDGAAAADGTANVDGHADRRTQIARDGSAHATPDPAVENAADDASLP